MIDTVPDHQTDRGRNKHLTVNNSHIYSRSNEHMYTRSEVMRPAHIFRDQVETVCEWFDEWNDIEQTTACYSLLKRLGYTQARFLSLVLEHTFKDSAEEVQALEDEANNRDFLVSLCQESKDVAVQQLLIHLPLLHPGNNEARQEYLKLLPKILTHSLEYSIHEEECRKLLSLALVHPAFQPEERSSLTWWLGLLDAKGEQIRERRPPPGFNNPAFHSKHPPLAQTRSAGELWRHQPRMQHRPLAPTHSYKISSSNHNNNGWRTERPLHHTDSGISTSFDNYPSPPSRRNTNPAIRVKHEDHGHLGLAGSLSLPVGPANMHQPLSPQVSLDSDEEVSIRKLNALFQEKAHSGMKGVPTWLKSLRLHKYSNIFLDLTYEEMMALSLDYLEQKNVTKGARKKIISSITKLKERAQTLRQLEKDALQLGKLPQVLNELNTILMSPLKPFIQSGEDIPAPGIEDNSCEEVIANLDDDNDEHLHILVTRVMGKACTQILVMQPDEDCCLAYLALLDRVLVHDAFSVQDKRRLQSWKARCQQLARELATSRKLAGIEKGGQKDWHDPLGYGNMTRRLSKRSNSLIPGMMPTPGVMRGGPLLTAQSQNPHKKLAQTASYNAIKRHHHQPVGRTNSTPVVRTSSLLLPTSHLVPDNESAILEDEGNTSLEALCSSMTNHALGEEQNSDGTF